MLDLIERNVDQAQNFVMIMYLYWLKFKGKIFTYGIFWRDMYKKICI